MDFKNYLREQGELHPAMEPQDAVKMIYQAAFGAEHLLADMDAARRYLAEELENTPEATDIPLFEYISEDMCRVNLGAWKGAGLPAEWLFQIFAATAGHAGGSNEVFFKYLQEADEEVKRGGLGFSYEDWTAFKEEYLNGGVRALHHSSAYREKEKPAYRLAARRFSRLAPVLRKAASLGTGDRPSVIAIDGRAASGKTTMAGQLAQILGGAIVRMDDFFLPPELRTPERFEKPGSNVHYERFCEEVLPYLRAEEGFAYRRFDCSEMDYDKEPVKVEPSQWVIVEGSYSHHPELGQYADLKVFSDVDPQIQMERIIVRNGAEMAEMFASRWIPMEEEYFSKFDIAHKADLKV